MRTLCFALFFALCTAWLAVTLVACVPPCGGLSQDCCSMGATTCQTGLACRGGGCLQSLCVQCGGPAQTCCDTGAPCNVVGTVCFDGACAPCGAPGEPCCGSSCNVGAICGSSGGFGGTRCVSCGAANEPCCAGTCSVGLQCQPTTLGDGTCVACGDVGEVCCAGSGCHNGLPCNANGTCGLCGSPGMSCCAGLRCASPAVCTDLTPTIHVCSSCGGLGLPCCDGVSCHSPTLFCSQGTCEPCGSTGLPCCASATCPVSGACVSGICTDAGDAGFAPSPCAAMSCRSSDRCLAYPAFVCTRPCVQDTDCDMGSACSNGQCLPSCTPGASNCDRFGGACFTGIAAYTSLNAPGITGTPTCIASCFAPSAAIPSAFPACATGTTCDPVSGLCLAGTAGTITVGARCTGPSDCQGLCLPPLDATGVPTGFNGGYCVSLARNPPASSRVPGAPLPASNCPPGGVAIPMPTAGTGDAIACYAACMSDCDCRVGYACDHDPLRLGGAPAPNGACLPLDCSRVGAACPDGTVCYRAGPFAHLLYPVCGPSSAPRDAGLDAGTDPAALNTGCTPTDAGLDGG